MDLDQPRRHFGPPHHSRAERELHHLLLAEPLATPCKKEHREGRYSLDFFFPAWRLGVEVDSEHFHDRERDAVRDAELAKIGIVILRLTNTMPAAKMREHIAYVAQRIIRLPLAEKARFVGSYKTDVLDHLQEKPKATARPSPRENCLDCSGNGWKLIPVWSEFLQRASMRATRCACTNLRNEGQLTLASEEFDAPA